MGIKFNTCISSLIEFLNEFHQEKISQKDLEKLLICSAPIFPHLTEEIWEKTGHEFSVHMQSWPKVDESAIKDDVIEIPVQINGKIRGKIILQTGATQKEAEEKVLLGGDFSSYLENKKIKKIVYVQDRIVSIVV